MPTRSLISFVVSPWSLCATASRIDMARAAECTRGSESTVSSRAVTSPPLVRRLRGRLRQLDRDPVRTLQIDPPATSVDPRGLAHRLRGAQLGDRRQALDLSVDVVDRQADVGDSDVARLELDAPRLRVRVLDQLEHRAAGQREVRVLELRVGIADERAHVSVGGALAHDRSVAEQRREPLDRGVKVRDGEAGVVDSDDGHASTPGTAPSFAPPSTSSVTPVRKLACSETKNIVASATSASVALRPSGFLLAESATIDSRLLC